MKLNRFLRSSGLVVSLALSACANQPTQLRPAPTLASDIPTCDDIRERLTPPHGASAAAPDRQPDGWVILAFSLAGDGVASGVRVVDSEPAGEFVEGAVRGLARARFKKGEV